MTKPAFDRLREEPVGWRVQRTRSKTGSTAPLVHRKEQVGVMLRTKDNTEPVFVSQGHKISLKRAIKVVLACCTKYRIPEPTRQAHLRVNEIRRSASKKKQMVSQSSLF